MTEEEAKTKWCPHVRFSESQDDRNASNRGPGNASDWRFSRCIGSACMAFRKAERIENKFTAGDVPPGPAWKEFSRGPAGVCWTLTIEVCHCGLAGKP